MSRSITDDATALAPKGPRSKTARDVDILLCRVDLVQRKLLQRLPSRLAGRLDNLLSEGGRGDDSDWRVYITLVRVGKVPSPSGRRLG